MIKITAGRRGYTLRLQVQDADLFRLLIDALKRRIPRFARRYDANERCWHISEEATSDLQKWLNSASRSYGVEVLWVAPEDQ